MDLAGSGGGRKRCAGWLDEGLPVHAFFNNDWQANAVADALWLRAAILA